MFDRRYVRIKVAVFVELQKQLLVVNHCVIPLVNKIKEYLGDGCAVVIDFRAVKDVCRKFVWLMLEGLYEDLSKSFYSGEIRFDNFETRQIGWLVEEILIELKREADLNSLFIHKKISFARNLNKKYECSCKKN